MTARNFCAALLCASALVAPQAASARTRHEAELEARVARLEAEMEQMRAALVSARDQQLATADAVRDAREMAAAAQAGTQATAAKVDANAGQLAALQAAPPPEGVRDGNTTIKIGGYLKMVAATSRFGDGTVATNSLGRDFYLAQTIPVGGKTSTDTDFSAKQTRLWLNFASSVAGHQVKGYLETDFQVNAEAAPAISGGGSQRTTNGYTLALRRAWLQVDKLLVGQEWSNFQNTAVLPETTDYVGGAEGTVFVRQPQVRYTQPLSKSATLSVAVENPESATAAAGAAALTENGTDHVPDLTARLAWTGKAGEASIAGLVRQVRAVIGGVGETQGGFGVSAAGKLWLNAAKTADVRAMVTYGRDIGRYVGLNFAPDAVYLPATGELEHVDVLAAFASVHVPLGARVRANLMGSYQHVDYADALPQASIATYNRQAFSLAGNLFYSPVKNVDLGIEYRHAKRELVSGASGSLDRVEFAAKYGF